MLANTFCTDLVKVDILVQISTSMKNIFYNWLRTIFSMKDNQFRRDRWVKEELSKIQKGNKILDAGCGTGLTGDNLHILRYGNIVLRTVHSKENVHSIGLS